jgi:hypothetical protein
MQGNNPRQHGTPETWDAAAQRVYGLDSVDTLEAEWLEALRNPPSRVAARNAGNTTAMPTSATGGGEYAAAGASRAEIRSSAAPALPILEPPIKAVRGVAPDTEPVGAGYPSRDSTPVSRPPLPDRPPPILLPPEIPRPAGR